MRRFGKAMSEAPKSELQAPPAITTDSAAINPSDVSMPAISIRSMLKRCNCRSGFQADAEPFVCRSKRAYQPPVFHLRIEGKL